MPARKRLNTRFLIILGSIVVVMVGTFFVLKTISTVNDRPEKYVELGDQALTQRKWGEAAGNFSRAAQLSPQDADVLVKLGDALHEMTRENTELVGRDRLTWEKALEVDPNNLQAMERLLTYQLDVAQIEPRADVFERMRTISEKISKLDRENKRAEAYVSIATIQQWLYGVEMDSTRIEECVSALATLMAKDPTNAELPLHIALARVKKGQDAVRLNQTKEAERNFSDAVAVLDQAIKAQPDNVQMQFRCARGFTALALYDTKNAATYKAKIKDLMERARQLVPTDDNQYVEIHLAGANFLLEQGDIAGSEKVVRALIEQRPEDQNVRLALARLLSGNPEKRTEALALLDKPFAGAEMMKGVRAVALRDLELRTLMERAGLRIDLCEGMKPGEERTTALKLIKQDYGTLSNKVGEIPLVLKLKGRLQLLEDDPVGAIQSLSRAATLFQQQGVRDYQLTYLLARGYTLTNQTGQAKAMLAQLLEKFDKEVNARVLLTQLLLRERAVDEAKFHLDLLEAQAPNDPNVTRLRVAWMEIKGEKGEAKEKVFAKLPETTTSERIAKAQAAVAMSMHDEAIRLLEDAHGPDAGNVQVAILLTQLYANKKDAAKAKQVVADALKANPDNQQLKLLEALLQDSSPEAIRKLQIGLIESNKDEFQRELQFFELSRQQGKKDEAIKHLLNAEKINGSDPQVMDLLFQYYLGEREFEKAAQYLDALGRANRDQAAGRLYRFRFYMAKGDYEKALDMGRELSAALPEFAQSWVSFAQALHITNQFDQAIQKYVVALERQSTNVDAMKGIIDCYYRLNKPADARRYIDQATKAFPNDPVFKELAISHDLNYGDPMLAIGPREQAVKDDPKQPGTQLALGQAYLRVSQVKTTQNDAKAATDFRFKARETFTKAKEQWPDERPFYAYLAEIALLDHNNDAAEKVLAELIARDAWKDKPEAYQLQAEYFARAGKLDQAEAALKTAVEKSKNRADIQQQLAGFLAQRGRFDEALKVLDATSPEAAANAQIQRQRIEIQINAGRLGEAEKSLHAAMEKSPNDSQLLGLLAFIHLNRNELDSAHERATQAINVDPKNYQAFYYRGIAELAKPQPDLDAVVRDLSAVRDANPSNVDARIGLSDAMRRRNDLEGAIRELEAALETAPLNKGLRVRLIDLCSNVGIPRWADVERLLNDAEAIPQFASDPTWARLKAKMWIARRDGTKAVAEIKRAMTMDDRDPDIYRDYLEILLGAKQYAALLKETDALPQEKRNAWWVPQYRALANRFLGEKDKSLVEFEAALNLATLSRNDDAAAKIIQSIAQEIGIREAIVRCQPHAAKSSRWKMILAYLYQAMPDYPNAIRMTEEVLKDFENLKPHEQIQVLRFAGTVYLSAKPTPHLEKAQDMYTKLLERTPDDLVALNNLACLLADNLSPPKPEQALKYSEHAYQLVSKRGAVDPNILDTHGWILVLNGRTDEGINLLRQAVEKKQFIEGHYHLGEAYLRKPNAEEAVRQLLLAANIIEAAQQKGDSVDPELKVKIDSALSRARELQRSGGRAAVP